MTPDNQTINRLNSTPTIYKRQFTKPDNRKLYLYGYEPHRLDPVTGENLNVLLGSEMRRHPLRGDWAIYAAKRQDRTFKPSLADNPLAPSQIGAPLTEIPFTDFELAVFENRFPGLHRDAKVPDSKMVETIAARGQCEVIVYSPKSSGSLATLGQAQRRLLLEAWIDRYQSLFSEGCAYVLPFENRGEDVGVTLNHPHGQIYGFPVVPSPQQNAVNAFEEGYDLSREVQNWDKQLHIDTAGGMQLYAPPIARFPYETWISAIDAVEGPWDLSTEQSDGFCHLLGSATARYDAFFGCETPYMLSLHAAPHGGAKGFQFTAQFYPLLRAPNRLKYLASVEQATGIFTVDVMPEVTAKALREVL